MALRPFAFSVRLREKGRTVRVQNDPKDSRRFMVEDTRPGEAKRVRRHPSAADAVKDAASTWRKRLH